MAKLTEEAGQFAGLTTEEANKPIAQHLEKIGALFALKKIIHQYPHCWRCKNQFSSEQQNSGSAPLKISRTRQ